MRLTMLRLSEGQCYPTRRRAGLSRHGFTLIELIVVIAIISGLLAVLLPSLSSARGSAHMLRCQTNLRQWGIAVNFYTDCNDGFLPRRGQGAQQTSKIDRPEDWFNALPPLIDEVSYLQRTDENRIVRPGERSIWMCPNSVEIESPNYFSYGMNMWLSTWQAASPDRIDAVASTDQQVFMTEGPGDYCALLPAAKPYSPVTRHDRKINIAFLDTHVTAYSGTYVGCKTGDPKRGDIRWVVPNSTWEGPGM